MANTCWEVSVSYLSKSGVLQPKYNSLVNLMLAYDPQGISVVLKQDKTQIAEFPISRTTECARVGSLNYVISITEDNFFINFQNVTDARNFHSAVTKVKHGKGTSVFTERTEDASANQYFQFYSYLSQQQNMMQDYVRTSTYQRAILANLADFKDKVVLDVGAGSGILSFFAAQAGARRVYAVEGSNIAEAAATLVRENNLAHRITVIAGKIEEISLPEPVDVIISEPMGFMLFNERMLESYLHAKKFLRPGGSIGGGRMYPCRGDLHVAPFTDELLYVEQFTKANFWYHQSFHGVNLSSLRDAAMQEYFRQPIVDTFDIRICMARSVRHVVDFQTAEEADLHRIEVPLYFEMLQSGSVHGLAFWFDVAFVGCAKTVWLSTSPTEPLTHWYQVRCLLEVPVFVVAGQVLLGRVLLVANQRQSYDVTMELRVDGTDVVHSNTLDLKNPYFRYPAAATEAPAEPASVVSPSEAYWSQVEIVQGAEVTLEPCGQQVNMEVYR